MIRAAGTIAPEGAANGWTARGRSGEDPRGGAAGWGMHSRPSWMLGGPRSCPYRLVPSVGPAVEDQRFQAVGDHEPFGDRLPLHRVDLVRTLV